MIKTEDLSNLYFAILDAVVEKLEKAESLKEVQTINYGERLRIGGMKQPAIWIIPNPYEPDLVSGHRVQHDIPFDFAVFVKSNKPEEGLEKAQDLAFKVYDVLKVDKTLGGLVSDVRPTRVDPAYEAGESTQLYWSAVQFTFRVQRRE